MTMLDPLRGAADTSVCLRNVTVVDTRTGKLTPSAEVTLEAGTIKTVRQVSAGERPAATRIVDGGGRYLVPGFLDMHVHSMEQKDPRENSAVLLAHGVTGIRQMAGTPLLLEKRRRGELNFGNSAPELLAMPGSLLTGANAATPEQAAGEVRRQKTQGADFIKTISVTPAAYFASLAEAKKLGLKYGGHMSPGVDLAKASEAGLSFIEHLGGPFEMTLIQCSKISWLIRLMLKLKPPQPMKLSGAEMESLTGQMIVANPILFLLTTQPQVLDRSRKLIESFSEDKCRKLAGTFAKNQTWQCPTLIRSETMRFADDPKFTEAIETRYLPAELRAVYAEFSKQYAARLTPASRDTLKRHKDLAFRVLRIYEESGVPMMSGSDYGGGWVIPGVAMHQEFDLLEEAGMRPLRVLQMTTLDAARFSGRESTLGTVEEGKDANLVLLERDPTASVQNLHTIQAVVRGGRYYSSDDLALMREEVASKYAAA